MRILYFTKGDTQVASSNERVWILSRLLKETYGIESEIVSARHAKFRVFLNKLWRGGFDILVVHKSLFTKETVLLILVWRLITRKPLVFDLDDAQWTHSRVKSELLARHAVTIFAGSHAIKEWAERFNKKVVLIPTLVDHEHFIRSAVAHADRDVYTIGWVGSGPEHFKQGNFHILKPALEEMGRRGARIRFRVVGARGCIPLEKYLQSNFYGLDIVSFVPYSEVPQHIHQFDIGVMPLCDTLFNRAKCGAKAIQYMACRVPPVVSPVGENKVIVEDRKNGFWATTTEEWVRAFETLLSSAELRNRFGEAGQAKIATQYSHAAVVKRYMHELETL